MSKIRLQNITKHFGSDVVAVEDLSLEIPDGHFAAFLGPSGCGKTTTMNMISGLEAPTRGAIYFNDEPVNHVPPGKRGVGFVFQNYAIFTHMSVFDNLAFGLRVRKLPKSQIEQEVRKVAQMLEIVDQLPKRAAALSVNDMQKVALGRVIVTNPRIFLLDEPFSNLDAAFRAYMRTELKIIQREIGQTMVYVTHDQVEAMSMADHIAVMNQAKLQQYGSPDDVYLRPSNLFVARFIGSPGMNFLPGEYREEDGKAQLIIDSEIRITLDESCRQRAERSSTNRIVLGIRPEHMETTKGDQASEPLEFNMKLVATEPLGSKTILHGRVGQHSIQTQTKPRFRAQVGRTYNLHPQSDRTYIFDAVTEETLTE
jgi:multiple sugar transport system ATP-binding protein